MNILEIIALWLLIATFFWVLVCQISPYMKESDLKIELYVWIFWILLPFYIVVLFLTTAYITLFRSDKYAKIKYNFWLIAKNLCGNKTP